MAFSKYAAYNLRTFFTRMPEKLASCWICHAPITYSEVQESLAVKVYLEKAEKLIPVHDFSHLYVCQHCGWWCVREVFMLCELGDGISDHLIVGLADDNDSAHAPGKPDSRKPWETAMADPQVYDNVLYLPAELGKLFLES